jgi:hypothetical protein
MYSLVVCGFAYISDIAVCDFAVSGAFAWLLAVV